MMKYRLTIVKEITEKLERAKYKTKIYCEEYLIGYFDSEKKLASWAKSCDGALVKANKEVSDGAHQVSRKG